MKDEIKQSHNEQNWRELMGMIQDQSKVVAYIVKNSTQEWSNEKNLLMKKIFELEKEVSHLKRVNNDIAVKINLTPREQNLRSSSTNQEKR